MATVFILGAGFSIPAEYPSAHDLNEKFFQKVEKNVLKFSSGEWAWDEYDDVTSHNGRLNSEHLNTSYLLSELIERYQKETFLPFGYEEFYDWINKEYSSELIKTCCNQVNSRLKAENQHSVHFFKNPDINEYIRIQECYSYLIADILNRAYKREENSSCYTSLIKLLYREGIADVFTLNHDTLFEFLLEKNQLTYSDGFSTVDSIIANDQNEVLSVFNNHYEYPIKLYKLHGSIDYYLFSEMKQNLGGVYNRTGNYWFFKTKNHWDKHRASIISLENNEVIQSVNPDIKPQFLTGKSKLTNINEHLIYKELYTHLRNSLQKTDKLIIIGYSYRDIHINKLIKEFLKTNSCEIININPNVNFPFRRNYSQQNILNLKSLINL